MAFFNPSVVRVFVTASMLVWAAAASGQVPSNQDLVGSWSIDMTSPQGTQPTTMTIREEAGELVGTMTGFPGPSTVAVKTHEAGVTMSFSVDYQGQAVPIVMTGKVAGAAIKGTVDYAGGAAAGDFSGTKGGTAPASSAAGDPLTGTWDVTGSRAGGYGFKLTQEGTVVNGVLRTPAGGEIPLKGKFENNVVTLAVAGDDTSGTMQGAFDGAALKGTYDIGGSTGSWSATRKP
jgi:hypothetical protein